MTLSSGLRSFLKPLGSAFSRLPGWVFCRASQFVIDAVIAILATFVAFGLRFDGRVPRDFQPILWSVVLLLPMLRAVTINLLGGHRTVWRYFSLQDAQSLSAVSLPPTALMVALRYVGPSEFWFAHVPGGVIVIEFGAFLFLASLVRAFRRLTSEAAGGGGSEITMRSLVIGNAETLAAAVRHLAGSPSIRVKGLLSVEPHLLGLVISGYPVIGTVDDLSSILSKHPVDLILLSDANMDCIGATVETATQFDINVRLLPSATNIMQDQVRVSAHVSPERVVERNSPVTEEAAQAVQDAYRDRCVLVTGAGGSIGSELCRQIARLPIASLVLLDRDENSIFEISGELSSIAPNKVVPLVGDIRDRYQLRRIFESHRPHVVLHAAAYKHVPVMEQNCSEAVLNNVVGTREVAECAFEFEAERFLMISTDKAVHPTSVMGASKRIAEQIVQFMGIQPNLRTRCACVRFGNVVGSRGSVVPIFLRQIAAGGPVTITDENMTRYFMTIPEAVQLVLQASTLGSKGTIYMLDMGDPIKVTAMARKLIEMSGLRPDKDIATKIVGARPGEKIHEQLWSEDADVSATDFARVFSVKVPLTEKQNFEARLKLLEDAARTRDEKLVRQCLHEMPSGFQDERAKAMAARQSE